MRFREFIREPEAVFWSLLFPIVLSVGLGIAFREQPPASIKVAAITPEIARSLRTEKRLDVQEMTTAAAGDALRTGKVLLIAVTGSNGVVYQFDNSNPDARNARELADNAVQTAGGRTNPVASTDVYLSEPGARYIDFLVPGMVGMGVMSNAVWGLAFSIVDARRRKLLKRIVATPMPKHYYLLSYLAWRMLILWVEVAVPIGFGMLVFGVPMRGSYLTLAGVSVMGSLAFSSIGLLLASRVRTIEAASGISNLAILPMWIVSGVFFSSERFPEFAQPLIQLLPLTALNDALRGIMLQGEGFTQLGFEIAVLGGWMLLCFAVALKLFRWR